MKNLSNNWSRREENEWRVIFGVAASMIWKTRNEELFEKFEMYRDVVYWAICSKVKEILILENGIGVSSGSRSNCKEILVGWNVPLVGGSNAMLMALVVVV